MTELPGNPPRSFEDVRRALDKLKGLLDRVTALEARPKVATGTTSVTWAASQASNVTVNVPHGLGETPTHVSFECKGTFLSNGVGLEFRWFNEDSDSFDVQAVASAVLTGTQDLSFVAVA